ncbi:MAG TPA: hypothetical protein VGE83_06360 [Terracidiphilus sp.]|jgi:hypothetical protein
MALVSAVLCILSASANGQEKPAKQPNPVRLELTMEVATTTDDGLPAALRFTLTNIGNVGVDMPMPAIDCQGPNGAIRVPSVARLDGPGGPAGGHGCGGGIYDGLTFGERVKSTWLHLQPGEYLNFSGDRRSLVDQAGGPATYEYWAEYEPPSLTPEERNELAQGGFLVPTENVESAHLSYSQR